MRTRVKICGITGSDDAAEAVACGADAIGFNFYAESVRYIDPKAAGEIIKNLPAFVTSVGLFVNTGVDDVKRVLESAPVDLLQFHGDETPELCRSFNRPFIKAIKATSRDGMLTEVARFPEAAGVLVDTVSNGKFGGTGVTFDWQMVPELSRPVILAGGLNADNVAEAIRLVQPFAVDVSGGVEKSKGIKDAERMKKFMESVQEADRRGV